MSQTRRGPYQLLVSSFPQHILTPLEKSTIEVTFIELQTPVLITDRIRLCFEYQIVKNKTTEITTLYSYLDTKAIAKGVFTFGTKKIKTKAGGAVKCWLEKETSKDVYKGFEGQGNLTYSII